MRSKPLVGRKGEDNRVVFDSPRRVVHYYFGKAEGVAIGAGICEIPEGSSNNKHAHHDADEVIFMLQGQARFVFPEQTLFLSPFEAVYVPRGVEHQIFNDGPGQALHTFCFAPPHPADAIRRKYAQR